ncbi:MAG: xanthine dehydrogenase family protein subunit M [Thermodesulfovibrionales bacterium]
MPGFDYVRPESLKEAVDLLSEGGAMLHAGGTDLLGCLRDGVLDVERLVSIGGLKDLRGIRKSPEGGLSIGAMTTIAEVAGDSEIRKNYTALAQGASEVASPQLRNQGTIGGNLCQKPRCWYYRGEFHCLRKGGEKCFAVSGQNQYHCVLGGDRCYIVHPSDTAPPLVAFGAVLRVVGPGGPRKVAVEDFHVPPGADPRKETVLERGEIVTQVLLPAPVEGLRSSYRKVRARQSWDFAVAGVAIALRMSGNRVAAARIALSGAAPVPWRSREAEETIKGRALDESAAKEAAEAAMREARPLAYNAYKVPLFKGLIETELVKLAGG